MPEDLSEQSRRFGVPRAQYVHGHESAFTLKQHAMRTADEEAGFLRARAGAWDGERREAESHAGGLAGVAEASGRLCHLGVCGGGPLGVS